MESQNANGRWWHLLNDGHSCQLGSLQEPEERKDRNTMTTEKTSRALQVPAKKLGTH